jgi:hypothetical protein
MQIIFLETLCNDERIIERNIRLKIQQSPDYSEEYYARSITNIFSSSFTGQLSLCYSAEWILKLEYETLETV